MKITKLETFCTQAVGFVRATADTGAQGWGQVSTYHSDIPARFSIARWRHMPLEQIRLISTISWI